MCCRKVEIAFSAFSVKFYTKFKTFHWLKYSSVLNEKNLFFGTLAWTKFQRPLKSTFLILLSISFDFEQGYCFEAKNAY